MAHGETAVAEVSQTEEKQSLAVQATDGGSTPKVPIAIKKMGVHFDSFDELRRFAQHVIVSGWAPKGVENESAVVVAIQMGLEVGLAPMQALQNIAVINGRPSIWGDAAKGLVMASGLCVEFEEYFEGKPFEKDYTAVCRVLRVGSKKAVTQKFSVEDAVRANLWANEKKDPWIKYPQRMLQMRARSWAIRDAFPDVMKGLAMREEARDFIDVIPQEVRDTAIPADDGSNSKMDAYMKKEAADSESTLEREKRILEERTGTNTEVTQETESREDTEESQRESDAEAANDPTGDDLFGDTNGDGN